MRGGSKMIDFFSWAAALLVTVPLAGYIMVFVLSKQLTGNHRRSVQRAIDFTTVFFILAVHFLVMVIWHQSYLWLIVLFLIFLALIFVFLHWKIRQEIDYARVFKGYWRFNFLVFFLAYLVLLVFGLYQRLSILLVSS